MNENFFVYILRCSDESYYVGSTNDVPARLYRHNSGKAADWTKDRRPVSVVYQEEHESLISARKREKQIKGWTRNKKENLINGLWQKM